MSERARHLKLAVDVGSEPITGSLAVGTDEPTSFCGWIELVEAIELARHEGALTDELEPSDYAQSRLG